MHSAQGAPGVNKSTVERSLAGLPRMMARLVVVERHVDLDNPLDVPAGIHHLDASVAPIGDVDVVVRVRGDGMQGAKLTRLGAEAAEGINPVTVLVYFGDARVYVAVADVSISSLIPGNISDLPKLALYGR